MPDYNKPLPTPDLLVGRRYWAGGAANKLMLPRCTSCSHVHFYPRTICPYCGSMALEWIEATGEGYLHAFAVQHRAFGGWAEEVPYVTAFIDLKEGDRVFSVLRGVDPNKPEELFTRVGALCRIEWERVTDDVSVPYWRMVE